MPLMCLKRASAAAIVAALSLAAGCRSPATAVVLVVGTNVSPARQFDLRVDVRQGESAAIASRRFRRGVDVAPGVIGSFAVVPRAGGEGPVEVDLEAIVGESPGAAAIRLQRRVRFAFTPGRTMQARVFLAADCGAAPTDPALAAQCPMDGQPCTVARACAARGLTCGDDARCVSPEVTPTGFERDAEVAPFTPDATVNSPMDGSADGEASTDASSDAPLPDATPEDVVTDVGDGARTCGPTLIVCDGMCVDPSSDARHCGRCGNRCPGASAANPWCNAGSCTTTCFDGFSDCDGDGTNGCEANLTSAATCGACGTRCAGATPLCDRDTRRCANGCSAGQLLCSGTCVNPQSSAQHCGACGNACGSTQTCSTGRCVCPATQTACGTACADLASDPANCGRCGNACPASESCVMGACACDFGSLRCGGTCTDVRSTTEHCGMCSNVCPTGPRGTPFCSGSACFLRCEAGVGDCDGLAANGCETNLSTSDAHCGQCRTACVTGACSPAGCSQWLRQTVSSTTVSGGAAARAIAADSAGNTFIVGSYRPGANFDDGSGEIRSAGLFMSSATPAGVSRWEYRFGVRDFLFSAALAVSGTGATARVIFAGSALGQLQFDGMMVGADGAYNGFVAEFTGAGRFVSAVTFSSVTTMSITDVALAPSGEIAVTGDVSGVATGAGFRIDPAAGRGFLLRLTAARGFSWLRQVSPPGMIEPSSPSRRVVIDGSGNLYWGAQITGVVDLGSGPMGVAGRINDILVSAWSPAGRLNWARVFGSVGAEDLRAMSIRASDGALLLAGEHNASLSFGGTMLSTGSRSGFVAELTLGGDHRWSRSLRVGPVLGLALEPGGRVFVAGWVNNSEMFGSTSLVATSPAPVFVGDLQATDGAPRSAWQLDGGGFNFLPIPMTGCGAGHVCVLGGVSSMGSVSVGAAVVAAPPANFYPVVARLTRP